MSFSYAGLSGEGFYPAPAETVSWSYLRGVYVELFANHGLNISSVS